MPLREMVAGDATSTSSECHVETGEFHGFLSTGPYGSDKLRK